MSQKTVNMTSLLTAELRSFSFRWVSVFQLHGLSFYRTYDWQGLHNSQQPANVLVSRVKMLKPQLTSVDRDSVTLMSGNDNLWKKL